MRRAAGAVILVVGLGLAEPALAAGGYAFAGFSVDGTRFLKRGADDRVCTVALPPACTPVDRKAAQADGFRKPPRSRKLGSVTVGVAVEAGAVVLRAGESVLGSYRPPLPAVSANANVFVSADEAAVAVEYERQGGAPDVVVFPLKQAAPAPSPPAAGQSPSPAPAPSGGNAFDRAMAKGGVWEQRLVPCDQASVHLVLKKSRAFDLRIDTKCQGDSHRTELAGKWTTEGASKLELIFENQNGPTEALPCALEACSDAPGEDCLTCSDPDISFTLQVVRR